jgi:hypothetical protein
MYRDIIFKKCVQFSFEKEVGVWCQMTLGQVDIFRQVFRRLRVAQQAGKYLTLALLGIGLGGPNLPVKVITLPESRPTHIPIAPLRAVAADCVLSKVSVFGLRHVAHAQDGPKTAGSRAVTADVESNLD